jgi:hypothetical protein
MAAGWLKHAVGEISKLRNFFTNFSIKITGIYNAYKLDSSQVKYELARALYDNTDDRYKLGAGFCRRVINSKLSFIGVPSFLSDDPDAKEALDQFFKDNVSGMTNTTKKALIEGRCIVWITRESTESALYPETEARLVYNVIPNEAVKGIIRDPVTRKPIEYIFNLKQDWYDTAGNLKQTNLLITIDANKRKTEQSGDHILELQAEEDHNWGFIPIIEFQNESDVTRESGQSELEPIEPFLKAYHDLFFHAIQGSKMHSTPRLKFNLKDVDAFLRNNFGIDNPREYAAGGGTINLDGKEFFIFGEGEDSGFIEVSSPSSGIEALLKFLFYCIVDASETPEFMFGVHTPSALSSVKEQMPTFTRTISRKRENFSDAWQRLARIVLAMTAKASGKKFSTYATQLDWQEIDPRDEKEVAETLKGITEALKTAIDGQFMSVEAAAAFLKTYIPTMLDYVADDDAEPQTERDRIIINKIINSRLEDGAANIEELKAIIAEILKKAA